jgi:hypothetical protein
MNKCVKLVISKKTKGDTVPFCIPYHKSVIFITKHNLIDLTYQFVMQHYYISRLSTSAINRQASVHTNNNKGRGIPDDG